MHNRYIPQSDYNTLFSNLCEVDSNKVPKNHAPLMETLKGHLADSINNAIEEKDLKGKLSDYMTVDGALEGLFREALRRSHRDIVSWLIKSEHAKPEWLTDKGRDKPAALTLLSNFDANAALIRDIISSPHCTSDILFQSNAFHIAAAHNCPLNMQALLSSPHCKLENPLLKENSAGNTLLTRAINCIIRPQSNAVVQVILRSGFVDPTLFETKDRNGHTPLYYAINKSHAPQTVNMILNSPHFTQKAFFAEPVLEMDFHELHYYRPSSEEITSLLTQKLDSEFYHMIATLTKSQDKTYSDFAKTAQRAYQAATSAKEKSIIARMTFATQQLQQNEINPSDYSAQLLKLQDWNSYSKPILHTLRAALCVVFTVAAMTAAIAASYGISVPLLAVLGTAFANNFGASAGIAGVTALITGYGTYHHTRLSAQSCRHLSFFNAANRVANPDEKITPAAAPAMTA